MSLQGGSTSGKAPSKKRSPHHHPTSVKVTKMIKAPKAIKHSPSSYLAEMKQSTEEKLAATQEMYPPKIIELLDIGTTSLRKETSVDIDQALFQPFPSEVAFQQFEPHQVYQFPLQLRNLDKVARNVKVTCDQSPYFTVTYQKPAGSKVAPGMEITFTVIFTPDEKKDYDFELVCITEREKFVVPVRAIGARALLDFPDKVHFSASPVKYCSTKTVLVRNVGNKEAKFNIEAQSPFSVSPSTATLDINACMQVNIDFTPTKTGDHAGELVLRYNTGEEVYTQLYGSARDTNVRLDRSSITMEDTFIGLSSQRSVVLHNRSDVVVHFEWKAFASKMEEEMQKEIRAQRLAEEAALSKETFFERCAHNPHLRDRLPILTRNLDMTRKQYVDDERFLYTDTAVSIDPVEGEIWPNSQAEISVVFSPGEATSYSRAIYCDITGREARLLLKIKGEGLGPKCRFSFDTLDIQNVFVNSAHAYEVILENRGAIEAVYSLLPSTSLFGPNFTFAPNSGVIQPGKLQAMQISFRSNELGEFDEEFQWRVEGAPHPLKLSVRGVVIGPTFQLDQTQIKFGTISYGFLVSREVTLTNTSEIPMTYQLRVSQPSTGHGLPAAVSPPTAATAIISNPEENSTEASDFQIIPSSGTLPPNFHQTIQVNFTPSYVKSYSTALLVDVDEAGREVFSIPITAKSTVPPVTLITQLLDYGRCFLRYPYSHNVEIMNDTSLPVKYEMPPQVDQSILVYSTAHPSGVIEPHSTLSIPLQIQVQVQGEIMLPAFFNIIGSSEPPLEVGLYCIGEGPVVYVTPDELHWGVCPVLTPISKMVRLSNESLIPAEFECVLAREKTIFNVDPISAVIAPRTSLDLRVTALVDDCLKFTDKLTIVVTQGVNFTVSLSGEGSGTTIVSHPPLQPGVNLGPHFSKSILQQKFTLTNRGRRIQALSWTTEGFSAAKLKKQEMEKQSRDMKDLRIKQQLSLTKIDEMQKPRFELIPNKCVLEPYQTCVVTLRGYSEVPMVVNERMICHAIIGKNPLKERIMTVDVTATFIAPLLEFSSKKLLFSLYQPLGSRLEQHTKDLSVKNVSPLPVTSVLMCSYPFSILKDGTALAQMNLHLEPGEDSVITVMYDSTYCVDKHSRVENNFLTVAYKEHPQKDQIELQAEVFFPNVTFEMEQLDFGCILNDTETIRYVSMTNNSPLEVRYSWSFLKRPPVQRTLPDHDEGVDMESECETDSLEEEESGRSSEMSGEREGEGEVELSHSRPQSVHIQIAEKDVVIGSSYGDSPLYEEEASSSDMHEQHKETVLSSSFDNEAAPEEIDHSAAACPSPTSSGEQHLQQEGDGNEVIESGLPPGESEVEMVVMEEAIIKEDTVVSDEASEAAKTKAGKKRKKAKPQPWEMTYDPFTPISIEQVFDILPLHGVLQPGESQQVQFTFYGHAGIATEVMAACKVEGGPVYQLRLAGEASEVQYKFDTKKIDFGHHLYDQVQSAEIVLYNRGKVELEFCAMGLRDTPSDKLSPGEISVIPLTGHIPALEHQIITINYLPGVPMSFEERFNIQVAHFEPDEITITGAAVFPRIGFNVPQPMEDVNKRIQSEARANLGLSEDDDKITDKLPHVNSLVEGGGFVPMSEAEHNLWLTTTEFQTEVERLLVKQFAHENSERLFGVVKRSSKLRPVLPEFLLDFGYVVYGLVVSRTITLSNVGHCPVSFSTAHRALEGTGYSIDLGEKIRALPSNECLDFTVRFDPAAIKCTKGKVSTVLPFNLLGGPSYSLRLCAEVTRPSMELSSHEMDFGQVICGQCKIITVRLKNTRTVRCDWTAITDKPPKQLPRHIPMHLRKKMKEKPPPKYFEVEPPSGVLLPGQTLDIRIKFMPSEEVHYTERIPFIIRQNADSGIYLGVQGFGSEPRLELDRNLLAFTPVLPFSPGIESEVNVRNQMPYPVEFYSLEFDKQYIEEEEILRWVKGYDRQCRLLLPPPTLGGSLPPEITQAYHREKSLKAGASATNKTTNGNEGSVPGSAANITIGAGPSAVSVEQQQQRTPSHVKLSTTELPQNQLGSTTGVGTYESKTPQPSMTALLSHPELSVIGSLSAFTDGMSLSHPDIEVSPVYAAIAHYLGIDLSPEALEAESRRGIAVIVHGPPSSGRTTQAKILGGIFKGAVLSLDDVLIDAISSASTPAGCRARECCIQAAQARAETARAAAEMADAPSNHSNTATRKQPTSKEKEKDKDKETAASTPSQSEPPKPFSVLPLTGSQYAIPEGTMLPTTLPEELIAEILTDRLQFSDCLKGIIFDGIESNFASSSLMSVALILRAFSNRKHIYFVNFNMELCDIKLRLESIELARLQKIAEEERLKREEQEREEARIEEELNMDEDEYEALSVEKQQEIEQHRLKRKQERRRREREEREERERIEREIREEEERRLEEEKAKKKGKKDSKKQAASGSMAKPPAVTALITGAGGQDSQQPGTLKQTSQQQLGGGPHTASVASVRSGTQTPTAADSTPKKLGATNRQRKSSFKASAVIEADEDNTGSSPLEKKHCFYQAELESLMSLLEDWDRQKGIARPKPAPEPEEPKTNTTPLRKGKGSKTKTGSSIEDAEKQQQAASEAVPSTEESREGLGVPVITVKTTLEQSIENVTEAIFDGGLPSMAEILEGMGEGPGGRPIPEPMTFQVYPLPLKRRQLHETLQERFAFIASSPDDPNAPVEEKSKPPSESEDHHDDSSHHPEKERPSGSSRTSKRATSVRSNESSDSGSRKSPMKPRKRSSNSKTGSSPGPGHHHSSHDDAKAKAEGDSAKPPGPIRLVRFRWVVPAGGEVKLKLLFQSRDVGQFDQTLNFEIVGTRRRLQLFCRGLCVVPSICREPRIVFANRKRTLRKDEIVSKRFVLSEDAYFFGPLHCGKTRERYKEGRYPENMETVTVSNVSMMETNVSFYFQRDHNATTFLLDPPDMALQPGESKTLTVWAYPKSTGQFKDALVCCVKDNPDPVIFNISCDGVEPDLKVDRKILEFKKVLLHRKQTSILHLHNQTLLPVAWKLSGLESLGEEFTFSQDHGVVQPRSDFPLCVHFRASRQVNYTKKGFKIEISDVEQIMGLMHVENIQITAEAYDVAMDVSFPRGADGGLDFPCTRVGDEQKLVVQLKNKGKYDIGFNFIQDTSVNPSIDFSNLFKIEPLHASLSPGEKAKAVSITFLARREITIQNQSLLKCQVIDTHVGEHGEVIANIPIRISAKAVFARFFISPINDINFGSMVVHSRKSATFAIENKGEFDFRYAVTKKLSAEQQQKQQQALNLAAARSKTRSREGPLGSARSSLTATKPPQNRNKTEGPVRTEVLGGSPRLVLGIFTVNQACGIILAGQSQTISVDCTGDKPGKHEEDLCIEISDRQKDSPPVPYKIGCEVLSPGINSTDVALIFEEHRICRELGVLGQYQFHEDDCVGVYGERERRFVFKGVIVGQVAKARFKISNPNKIPCDVQLSIKSSSTKQKGIQEAFTVEPTHKVAIPPHSHFYATVTFKPGAIHTYYTLFEAVPDGTKGKGLSFDIQGDGNLPQVSLLKPTLKNPKGYTMLLFKRILRNQSQFLPLTLKNTGTIPATVLIETISGTQAFTVVPAADENAPGNYVQKDDNDHPKPSKVLPPPEAFHLAVNETRDCMIMFRPSAVKKYRGELCVRIQDNQFEKLPIQLIGEGYEDEVCVENIRGQFDAEATSVEEVPEDIDAAKDNQLNFGSIPVGTSRQVSFSLSNHSKNSVIRFQWPTLANITFSPAIGHIKPRAFKGITVTFKSSQSFSFTSQKFSGEIKKILFSKPLNQIPDWDDRMKSIRWVKNVQSGHSRPTTQENGSNGENADTAGSRGKAPVPAIPAKKKVIETEPEPPHSDVENSSREVELIVSAIADFAKYECPIREVNFRETLMYQTRVYTFPLKNTGLIVLSYQWAIVDSDGSPLTPHSSQLHLDSEGSVVSEGGEMVPFSVSPMSGQIGVGEEALFTMRFSPLDVLERQCTFRCNIAHLDSSMDVLELQVRGSSLMPYCHFELEPSDYLTERASGSGGGDLSCRGGEPFGSTSVDLASTRVIEFSACGVGLKNVRKFNIVNPTSSGYEFEWTDESSTHNNPFKCLTARGFVAGGKKAEIAFEYLPTSLELFECLWKFSIPSLKLYHSFLLVGHTSEPAVNLDRAYVSFKCMRIKSKAKEIVYLVNNEPSPFQFSFVEKSCHCDGHTGQLVVSPMKGTIQPNQKLPIEISFTATQDQDFNFNLQCRVKRKPTPLVLNVKAQGYAINAALSYTSPDGEERSLPIAKNEKRMINFGHVPVNERALGRISLYNNGQYALEYRWVLSERCLMPGGGGGGFGKGQASLVSIDPEQGSVEAHDKICCEMVFAPPSKITLKGCEILLDIVNGPTLPILLRGHGVEPLVDFSFEELDFGPCVLHHPDMPPHRRTLVITNKDTKDISVNLLFKSKPYLAVDFESQLLPPNKEAKAMIQFRPSETVTYCEDVIFEINGLSKRAITIRGEGAQMKIELANPSQKIINFGALRINDSITKTVKLVNYSPTPLTFTLSLLPSSSTPALQEESVLSVTPSGEITLKANKGSCNINVVFSPKSRVPHFSEEVTLECLGTSQPLFVVKGSCHGLEISLDTARVPFGAVTQHSKSSRRILMINSGDIGASFRWEAEKFEPDFTISPVDGYISPGMQITFDLTFHPRVLSHDIRYEDLPCYIEGMEKPLHLTLSGVCIEKVPFKDVLQYSTTVRTKETRHLTIPNKSNSQWLIRPIIDGEYWSGPETLSIGPTQSRHYELIYHPLTMTTDMQKHQGSIFFPLPDGTGLLYNLQGTAEPPKHTGTITQEIPCKTAHTELLPVENWLRRPQRFRVTIDMIRPDKLDRSVSLHGLEYIDVPALGRRDYQLHFYSFKECSILAKVIFRNESTGEYLYYHVSFKSTPPGIIGTLDLTTAVRSRASDVITITNPLPTPVTMTTSTNNPDISMPMTFLVGAQSEGKCMFEYLPLKVGESTAKLSLQSSDLGVYQYELHLVATPPPPERVYHFTTHLGSSHQQHCSFVSYAKGRTEYTCKVDNTDFHVDKTITVASAAAGSSGTADVIFEPSHLGDVHTTLTISSPSGGDYIIPLHGHCLPPKPQGPFIIKPGSSLTIPFKNIYMQTKQFTFSIDNPAFVVKSGDSLKSRKIYNILVSYDAKQADAKVVKTAKLTVACLSSAKAGAGLHGEPSWVFYLKGVPPM